MSSLHATSAPPATSAPARSRRAVRTGRMLSGVATASDAFAVLWLAVLPITSILVIPQIQGTTPANLCAAMGLMLAVLWSSSGRLYFMRHLTVLVYLFVLLQALSLLASGEVNSLMVRDLTMTNPPYRPNATIQPAQLTQAAYLLVMIITALYVRHFADTRWLRWLFIGPMLLGVYGLVEWGCFFKFEESVDILSNRQFAFSDGDLHVGSLVQSFELLGLPFLRLKSLTGEPSMFTLAILPYFCLAWHLGKRWMAAFLGICLLLSTSTTAFICLGVAAVFSLWTWRKTVPLKVTPLRISLIFGLFAIGIAVAMTRYGVAISSFLNENIWQKLAGMDQSGSERFLSHQHCWEFFLKAPLGIQLFGLGFGVTRPFSFLDWLLVNCGVVGTTIWLSLFLYPVWKLPNKPGCDTGLKVGICTALVAMILGVPEFGYPTTWLFLGLAYARLDSERRNALLQRLQPAAPESRRLQTA